MALTWQFATTRDRQSAPASHVFAYAWREGSRQQLWLCLLALTVFLLTLAPLELQRHIIDDAIATSDLRLLVILGAAYLTVILLQGSLKYLFRVYRGTVSERAVRSLRKRVYSRREDQQQGSTDEAGQGRAVSMVAAEVERLGGFVGESFSEPVLQFGILASVLGYMFVVEPRVAAVALIFFLPQVILVPLIQRVVNRRAKRKVQLVRDLGDEIAHEDDVESHPRRYAEEVDQVYRTRISYFRLKFLQKFINNILNHLGPLSVLMVGGYYVITGVTTIGTVVAFISGFERMADPSRRLLAYYRLAAESQVQYRLLAGQLGR